LDSVLPVWMPSAIEDSRCQPAFTPGAAYTEKEVNLIIKRFNADVSGLRRDLVDAGMLQRERDGSKYWREAPHD